jgi:hypothetical protein
MDSLFTLLDKKDFEEPLEVKAIKKYVLNKFNAKVGVQVREKDIIVLVNSAALANTLRLSSPEMKRQCNLNKRLSFRIEN